MGKMTIVYTAVFLLACLVLGVLVGSAKAHDWFPKECCSGQDCKAYSGLPRRIGDGYLLNDGRTVPMSRVRNDGQQTDDRWYLCESTSKHIYCLFPPPGGV